MLSCTDEETLTRWTTLADDYKDAKIAYNTATGAVTEIQGELYGAEGGVTAALDAAEEAKVKSDSKTFKQLKDHEKILKAAENEWEDVIPVAEQAVQTAKEETSLGTKIEGYENAVTALKEKLTEGTQEATM